MYSALYWTLYGDHYNIWAEGTSPYEGIFLTRTRFITALVALPIVVVLIRLGNWPFFVALTAIGLLATWEYVHILQHKGHRPNPIFACVFFVSLMLDRQLPAWEITIPTITFLLMLLLVWELFQTQDAAQPVDWALTAVGGIYIGLGLSHLLGLRLRVDGQAWVWVAIACTWGADTLAYFGGRAWGRHKFWPRWSPKKTWEGFMAGIFGGMLGGWIVTLFLPLPLAHVLAVGVLVALVGPFGDLSVSMIKRYTGVKDSSQLLPGHGGFLDRIDSILFAAVVVFYYAAWIVG